MDIKHYLEELKDYIKRTDHLYHDLYENSLVTHPIPFFGNINTADVLAVAVNPSLNEFRRNKWPEKIVGENLYKRLISYFQTEKYPFDEWFEPLDKALKILNRSYLNGTVAHLDLSPRATVSMGVLHKKKYKRELFKKMIVCDMEWFFKLFDYCQKAKLVIILGTVMPDRYIDRFLKENASPYDYFLNGQIKHPKGKGKTAFYELAGEGCSFPVFFLSVQPSKRNPGSRELILKRFQENKERLLDVLNT